MKFECLKLNIDYLVEKWIFLNSVVQRENAAGVLSVESFA